MGKRSNTSNLTANLAGERYSQPWMALFVRQLRECPSVARGATVAGVARTVAYHFKKLDEAFSADWEEALESHLDGIGQNAFELAQHGQREPIVNAKGDVIGERVTQYPRIIEFMLSSHRSATYGKRESIEHIVAGGGLQVRLTHVEEAKEDEDE